MTYREPGAYVGVENTAPNTGVSPALIPVIFGEGRKLVINTKVAVVRAASGLFDVLPVTTATTITGVYLTGVSTAITNTQYSLTAPNKITWEADATDLPDAGETYYVSFTSRPEASDYELKFLSSFADISAAYGPVLIYNTGTSSYDLNPVALGAYLTLESGAVGIYSLQVEPADKTTYTVVTADWQTSLDSYLRFEPNIYRLVPMTRNTDVLPLVYTHINTYSLPEEKMERTALVSYAYNWSGATSDNDGLVATATYTSGTAANKRVIVPWPDVASKTLTTPDTNKQISFSLTGEYICAAIAGLEAAAPTERSLTRQKLYNFDTLSHTKVTRTQKNLSAPSGVMILEQPAGAGTAIQIRHGLTTLYDNLNDREASIVRIVDYSAKLYRSAIDSYIGIYNINADVIARISGTVDIVSDILYKGKLHTKRAQVLQMAQDATNPDTILLRLRLFVATPLNYVDITLVI